MKITDFRDAFKTEPPVEKIEEALSLIPAESLVGVREVRLYDDDPRSNKHTPRAYARWVHKNRARHADIELYFWRIGELDDLLRENQLYVLFLLIRSFSHEVFHHSIGAQRRLRKPKKHIEELRADDFAQKLASHVVHILFPKKKNRGLWRSMEKAVNKQSTERNASA